MTEDIERLFDFSDPATAGRFVAIDDRVMGGVSRSGLRRVGDWAVFAGELSTERNGGFASVRSTPGLLRPSGRRGIALRVRGDGRTYKLGLRTDAAFDGVSYQAAFATTPEEWTTIRLPFETFRPTYRGRPVPDAAPLAPAAIVSVGLLVSDGQVGAFRLELEWIGSFGGG